ncbi:MAG: STAS domain-containing protein, partial [Clostridiales bacterium]|nr:STAS domain-containing protein [Clostridiales bacterium]
MKTRIEGDYIAAFPEGRITYDNAGLTEQELRKIIEDNPDKELIIDAEDLEYVSSAGLRVLFALPRRKEGKLAIRNAGPELYEILDMTGFTELFNVSKKMKTVSVEGCEIIGKGAYGTVYKID